jgi:diacylglycerol kinase (ATP)
MSKKMKSNRAKLIVNPVSGKAEETPARLEQAVLYLNEHGIEVDVAFAAPKEEALTIAKNAVKNGYKIVIVMGGDGTIGEVIRGIVGSKATLGILVGGTMNDIAASLGIPEDIEAACELIASGQTRQLDLGQIKTDKYKKFYFFMVTVIGLTATLYPKVKKIPKGDLSSLKEAVITFLNYKPKPEVFLTLDDESKIKVNTMLVTIANTPLIASKNLVAPEASMEDGLFDISVFPDFSKAEVLGYFARTAKEGLIPDGNLQRFRARKIKVKTSPELAIAADGINLGKGTAVIKMCPGALSVFAPPLVAAGVEKQPEENAEALSEPLSPVTETNEESSQ